MNYRRKLKNIFLLFIYGGVKKFTLSASDFFCYPCNGRREHRRCLFDSSYSERSGFLY